MDFPRKKHSSLLKIFINSGCEKFYNVGPRLVLVNTLYFKGSWKYPFKKSNTETSTFYVDNMRQTNISAMSQIQNFKTFYAKELSSEILELPYKGPMLQIFLSVSYGFF
jgi:serpin B